MSRKAEEEEERRRIREEWGVEITDIAGHMAHVQSIRDAAPEFTEDQRARLSVLLKV